MKFAVRPLFVLMSMACLWSALATYTHAAETQQDYCTWQAQDYAIAEPLCGLQGDAKRGREIVVDQHLGNCLACHALPIPEQAFHGNVGPSLWGVGARYNQAQIRMRVVDETRINPDTIMPGFYRHPKLFNRLADRYWGKTFLTAQQVEDVVSYLATLKEYPQ
ncbi:MAG: sulfur oxidation c-type cytochrome SoxX [Chromatiales bacterium]